MGLIEIYHVVADQIAVNPAFTNHITEGMCVALDTDGTIRRCTTAGERVYGIAGDTQNDDAPGTPYAADLIMGAGGNITRSTQNRVSDMFNETAASGLLTVYTSGGKFATDQYAVAREANLTPNTPVYTDASGQLTDVAGAGNICGLVVSSPGAYSSGVPGIDTADNNISLGDYVVFKLLV